MIVLINYCFNDTATTEIYTLSLHDALPICRSDRGGARGQGSHQCAGAARERGHGGNGGVAAPPQRRSRERSEEHTSELQSRENLVCRLLLEKKKTHRSQHLLSHSGNLHHAH